MLFNTALDADNTPSLKTSTLKKLYSIMKDHDLCDIFLNQKPRYAKIHLAPKNSTYPASS